MKTIAATAWGALFALPLLLGVPAFGNGTSGVPVTEATPQQPAASPASPPAATFIPTEEISRTAARTEIRLREVQASTRPSVEVRVIAAKLPDLQRNIAALARQTTPEALDHQSRRYITNLAGEWKSQSSIISRWEALLSARLEKLAAMRKELQESAAVWDRSEKAARESEAPSAVVERAAATYRAVLGQETTLRAYLDEVLELDNAASELALLASDAQALIDAQIHSRRAALFHVDAAPIWRWQLGGGLTLPGPAHIGLGTGLVRSLSDFQHAHVARIRLHALLALALALLVGWTYRQRRAWRDAEPETAFFARLLDRPVATTVLLVLVVLTPLVYPTAPVTVYQAVALAAAPFLALLLSRLVPAPHVRAGYAAIVLYVLDPIPDILAPVPGYSSLLLLIESAAALAVALVLRRGPARRGGIVSAGIRIAAVLLAVAVLGVLVGARSLAGLLFTGTVRTAYAGILLYATVAAVQGVWGLVLRTRPLRWVRAFQLRREQIRIAGSRVIAIVGGGWWVKVTLGSFYLWSPVRQAITGFVKHRWQLGTLNVAVGDVLLFVIVIWISVLLSRFVRSLLDDDVFPRLDLPRGVPATISTMIRYGVIALGFTAALAAARIPLDRFAVLAGALGVGIGFGLQNIVNNFVSGLVLVFERPVQVGDTVQVANWQGQLQRIGVRASTIRTFDGAEVLIPNGTLISNDVVNWTLSDRTRRIEILVGVAYGSDPTKVLALLTETAAGHSGAMAKPAPQCLLKGFGESSLNFLLRFWTAEVDDWLRIQSEVTVAVHDRLREAGIEIPFPQRDLHLRMAAPAATDALRGGAVGRGAPPPPDH